MLQYSKDGVSVAVWLDTRKSNLKGTYPVKVRVTSNRQRSYYPTGKSMTVEEWGTLPRSKSKGAAALRKDIENSYNIVRDAVEDLLLLGSFSLDALKVRLRGANSTTVNSAFREKIEEQMALGRVGNASVYDSTLKSIVKFGGNCVKFSNITQSWLSRFAEFLQNEGITQTSIAIKMRTLRAILNSAKKLGIIKESEYPFGRGKYEIQAGEGRKLALTLEQIGSIARYNDGSNATARYRDYWMFLYFCNGINVADFVQLKYKDIIGDEIFFKRQKTLTTSRTLRDIRVVLIDQMRDIIERWGNPYNPESYIFPHLKGGETPLQRKRATQYLTRAINRRMAQVAKELGIPHISTYTARHSFATVLKRSGANIAFISESLGHSDLKTTENYLASFESEERRKNAELLTKF